MPCENNSRCIENAWLKTLSEQGLVANSATTATSTNTANAIVARDGNGDFAARGMTFQVLRTSIQQGQTYTLLQQQNGDGHPLLRLGSSITFLGYAAGKDLTVGGQDVGIGALALRSLTAGSSNTAVGMAAGTGITTGSRNTAVGHQALSNLTASNDNTAVGYAALQNLTNGVGNIAVGANAGKRLPSGNGNIYIGNEGSDDSENQTIRIGDGQTRTFIAGIRGVTATGGIAVYVAQDGQLGTSTSSARFKHDVEGLGDVSARIHELRPVSFRYLPSIDASQEIQYGLIAEEVEEVMPELVARDENGEVYTVKYHLLTPLLLNEVQRLRRELDAALSRESELLVIVERMQAEHAAAIAGLEARLEAILAGLRGGGSVDGLAHAAAGNHGGTP